MKTKTVERFEVRSQVMPEPLVVETKEQLSRFLEAATEFGGATVRRQEITVTETDWEPYTIDEPSADREGHA